MDHHYKTLEIQPGASQDEIRVAYRKMMLKYHPDKFDGNDEKCKQIVIAYNKLRNPDSGLENESFMSLHEYIVMRLRGMVSSTDTS